MFSVQIQLVLTSDISVAAGTPHASTLGMTTTNEIRTETINWLLENVGDHATLADIESALQWATDEIWQENAEIPLERGRWAIVAEAGALSVYPDPDGFGSLPKTVNKILGRVRMALRMRAVEKDD